MSDYDDDDFDMSDKKPVRDTNKGGSKSLKTNDSNAKQQNVRFKLGGNIDEFGKKGTNT